ncbi:cellulase family glycosylhydrolase [Nakamurella endophytica]|uniref:Glycoside hydrolase family 5 domain-containing protein n=1 Tax=Nakamurella endophytica TaxID=1748367 RepID=A0A917SWZ7_9ACTN|nr:cellulase family glycosylhydrolase [Nakamurella endophytica]GGM00598.1 hypothetical protein GCM10011594_20900 [Nakamurella endophytica]
MTLSRVVRRTVTATAVAACAAGLFLAGTGTAQAAAEERGKDPSTAQSHPGVPERVRHRPVPPAAGGAGPTAGAAGATAATSGGTTTGATADPAGGLTPASPRPAPGALRLLNYYPADDPWTGMWTNYSHARTDTDFADIASLGANAVRVIVQPGAVGWPTVGAAGAAALADMVDTAAAHGLYVQLTLFDLWSAYSDITRSRAWAQQLLHPYRADGRIALVELQNEMPTTDTALAWAKALLPELGALLPGVPRSVSEYTAAALQAVTAAIPDSSLDVVDVHLYGAVENLPRLLQTATGVARGRPVVVGEAGTPTVGGTTGAEQAQLSYYQTVAQLVADQGIPTFAPWILSDYVPDRTPSAFRTPTQVSYGLRRLDGSWKPAAAVVRDMFAGAGTLGYGPGELAASRISYDGDFENEDAAASSSGLLGSWRTFDASAAGSIGVDAGGGVDGSASAVLDLTGGSSSAVPAVYQSFLLLSGKRTVTASASVRLVAPTGFSRIAIAWFDGGTYLGSTESVNARNTVAGWQTVAATGTAPATATAFQIHLKSAYNSGEAYFDAVRLG